mmetsp:Transcript_26115/g.47143  ORF Transcript_26115/g.47143 Transcript_26115/m.47143 type:complete len:212 (-) Transcript_26115:2254-2889(-)
MAALADFANNIPQESSRTDVDTSRGLVQQNHIWLPDECECRGKLPLVSTRKVLANPVLVSLKAHPGDHRLYSLWYILCWDATDSGVKCDGLPDSQLIRKRIKLRTVAQVASGFISLILDVRPCHSHFTRCHFRVSCDHAHCGRLASTVDTEQPEAFSRGHTYADATNSSMRNCLLTKSETTNKTFLKLVDQQGIIYWASCNAFHLIFHCLV